MILRFLLLCLLVAPAEAQRLDLLLKGGRVIDPRNGIDAVQDVGIADGLIAQVAPSIPAGDAARVVDASGLIVTPGLIDLHAHLFYGTEEDAYLGNGFSALPPDGFTFRTGVTTAVDAGGAGWRTFRQFHEQTIAHSQTRVLAFINIVGAGMKGGPTEQNTGDMDAKLTAMEIARYPNEIVGVKLAHYDGPDWMPVDRAVEAGALAGVPVMIDFGRSEPPLPLEALFMEHLRPGDIFTHTYGKVDRREGLVENGVLRPLALSAQQRGIVFDVGHGGGSFLFSQAVPATRAGFWPATLSTDLHTGSMNGGMKTIDNVMSKFLVLGMPLPDVIAASTWKPAQVIHREELGHLSVGAEADVAVFQLEEGVFGYIDSGGFRMDGDVRLVTEMTVRAGEVVWDLNGRSHPGWYE
ncbi:MAG: amidohydrolase/deacetylase family metallohydrolase [Rhodothermales bacterium]|nr:amidohydrolase/deacetylase family metallohydrolase [Rhodothermales bacterium]